MRRFIGDKELVCLAITRFAARLVVYNERFWSAVKEVCTITEPLVRVLCLAEEEKPTMGYLYEAIDRAKESIHAYYEDKGDQGQERQQMI